MIPLRDANPTRRTPVVTLSIIAACFVAFGIELYVMWQGGEDALVAFIDTLGDDPGRAHRRGQGR